MFSDATLTQAAYWLGLIVLTAPLALVAALGLASLYFRSFSENAITRLVQGSTVIGLVASVGVLAIMLLGGRRDIPIEFGHWVEIEGFHFHFKFMFDRLSVPMSILSYMLCGTIGAFGSKYLHREQGYNRFFVSFALFNLGMVIATLAGTIECLFIGWELVGLSSTLLVAFFQERAAPVKNGLHVWTVYRVSDAALLLAAVVLHHLRSHGDFDALLGQGDWPFTRPAGLTEGQALAAGLLVLVAVAGKSALMPFSGWLPRAMEGPTPSSAVFYGALSVHLGAFLLLRLSPLLDASPILRVVVVALGLLTAGHAVLVGRVQSDIKTALSYASLTQVGIIVAEIGLGCRYIALCHILGHACLRTLQFLRAPTILHDYHQLENAIGDHLPQRASWFERLLPVSARSWWYRFALERAYLDSMLMDFIVRPFLGVFRRLDRMEQAITRTLSGGAKAQVEREASSLEDLA